MASAGPVHVNAKEFALLSNALLRLHGDDPGKVVDGAKARRNRRVNARSNDVRLVEMDLMHPRRQRLAHETNALEEKSGNGTVGTRRRINDNGVERRRRDVKGGLVRGCNDRSSINGELGA